MREKKKSMPAREKHSCTRDGMLTVTHQSIMPKKISLVVVMILQEMQF
jgi:hypothetical protein